MELTILPSEETSFPEPDRGPSTIIFKKTKYDGIQGVCYDDGDAFWEQEASMLDTHAEEALEADASPGWYVIEEFRMFYSQDYWGEWDGQAEFKTVRPAKWSDFRDLWWVDGKAPWFVATMAFLGLKMPAWWPEP